MKHTRLAASFFLGCMSISVFASDLLASERKLGVVYSLNDDKYIGKIRKIDKDEEDEIIEVIDLLKENVVGEPEYSSVTTSLKLVIQTEFPWFYSDIPDYQDDKSHDWTSCDPIKNKSCITYLPQNYSDYFSYMSKYAEILSKKNVKFTPLLGIHDAPDWLKISLNSEGGVNQYGHAMPFPISGDKKVAWDRVNVWLKKVAETLREYTFEKDGQEPTIQEVLITNEMMYEDASLSKELIEFLQEKRATFIQYIDNQNVKVGWKLAASLVDNETKENLELLLAGTDIVGLNIEEGSKARCCTMIDKVRKIRAANFKGVIYISEYNTQSGAIPIEWSDNCIPGKVIAGADPVGKFSSDQLTNCILTSFDKGVTELTFYKWNEVVEKKDVLMGLHDAFQTLKCNFPDVPKSDKYDAITKLCKMGVLNGHPDGRFAPEEFVNRAEFSKMLVGLAEKAGKKFSEITPEDLVAKFSDLELKDQNKEYTWYLSYIGKLKEGVLTLDKDRNEYFKGIIDGYPDELFRPDQTINMAEMLKMIILTFTEYDFDRTGGEKWYIQYLEPAIDKILPIWDDNKFRSATKDNDAKIPVTRAMAAKAMYDAYSTFKK